MNGTDDALVESVIRARLDSLLVEARDAVTSLPRGDRRATSLAAAVANIEHALARAPKPARRPHIAAVRNAA